MVSPATLDSLSPSSVASVYPDVAYGQDLLNVVQLRFNAAVVNGIVCTAFWAVFSGLVLLASAVVWRNRTRNRSSWIPALSILVLYLLSTIYWVTSALFALYAFSQELTRVSNRLLHDAQALACDILSDCQPSNGGGGDDPTNGLEYIIMQSVLPNITFSTVVALGDAIVWWRVVTIWPGRRLIVLCGVLFPALPFVLGGFVPLILTAASGMLSGKSVVNDFEDVLGNVLFPTWAGWQSGTRWWYSPYGVAASGLSLVSNALATCLIGRKLQLHWAEVQEHLNANNTRSRAVEVLSLLVESGGLYALLWTVMLAFQITVGSWPASLPGTVLSGFDIFFGGCLPMLVAMYPTVIILIVALQRSISHPRHGIFSHPDSSPISVRLDRRGDTLARGNLGSPSQVLSRSRDDENSEEGDTYKAGAEVVLSAHAYHGSSSVVHICGSDCERSRESSTRSDEEKLTS